MKKKEKWIKRSVLGSMAALAVMAVVGCAEEVTQIFSDSTKVEVTASFGSTDSQSLTRAADGLDNATSGFSLLTSANASSKVRVMVDANNGTYSPFDYTITNATTITAPATPPSFPSGVNTVNVYGWYPNVSLTNFSVNANQQSEENYCLSDLMVATGATCVRSGSSVTQSANLSFAHVMSKVKVSLTLASGVTVSAVKLKSMSPQVTVTPQITDNAVASFNLSEASGTATDITLLSGGSLTSSSAAADKVLCGVFPPQSKDGAFLEITASYNSGAAQTITYSFGSAKTFARANEYTMNITLNGTNVTTGTVDISDWSAESGEVTINAGGGGDAPTLDPTSLTLTYGGSNGTITPTLTGASTFSGVSSNTGIATVSGTSTLTVVPVAAGTCTINVFPTNKTGTFSSATCEVTVNKAAQSVSLSTTTLGVDGLNTTKTFTVTRSGNGTITAASSNTSIATTSVNQSTGVVTVTGKAAGSATITVTVAEGTNHLAYSATDKTIAVTVTEWTKSGMLLSAVTSDDVGHIVAADGKLYGSVASATAAGTTVVGVLAYSGSTGHGYIVALQNSANGNWSAVNGYTAYSGSIASASGSKLVPSGSYNGLSSYTTLGSTAVSNWVVLTKDQYTNMWNQFGGATNGTYNSTSNGYITAAGGTALSGYFYSCTPDGTGGWYYYSNGWYNDDRSYYGENGVRPVLAF